MRLRVGAGFVADFDRSNVGKPALRGRRKPSIGSAPHGATDDRRQGGFPNAIMIDGRTETRPYRSQPLSTQHSALVT
jgi:hypothetical protein